MKKHFKCISIIGNLYHEKALKTYKKLYKLLIFKKYKVIIEKKIAYKLNLKQANIGNIDYIGKNADLAIVIGGDGNILNAARILSSYNIKIIGVNRGNLGFLADLSPYNLKKQILSILEEGKYFFESRFLLEVKIFQDFNSPTYGKAINEVLLHSNIIAKMIDYKVYIDNNFAFSQRANGLIISTPTGSTAYALSAGGPILTPSLNAIVLIPIFSHNLSVRPLVISSDSIIQLSLSYGESVKITCDNQITFPINKNKKIFIRKSNFQMNFVHPSKYCYFHTLTSKLGWAKKLF